MSAALDYQSRAAQWQRTLEGTNEMRTIKQVIRIGAAFARAAVWVMCQPALDVL